MSIDKLNKKERAELVCLEKKLEKEGRLSPAATARLYELRRRAQLNGQK